MDLSDKILVLLSAENFLESDKICLLLGRDWDMLKEEIGIMRMHGWLYHWDSYVASTKISERCYSISPKGREELQKRIDIAVEKKL